MTSISSSKSARRSPEFPDEPLFRPLPRSSRKHTSLMLIRSLTATEVYRQLRDSHGYRGSYTQVLRFLNTNGRNTRSIHHEVSETIGLAPIKSSKAMRRAVAVLSRSDSHKQALQQALDLRRRDDLTRRPEDASASDTIPYFWLATLLLRKRPSPDQYDNQLSEGDLQALLGCLSNSTLRVRRRAATVLLRAHGASNRAVARLFKCARGTTALYWKDYSERGMDTVTETRIKRIRMADREEVRSAVFAVFHSPPASYGINRTTWCMDDLHGVLTEQGHPMSVHVIRDVIKSAGYRWRHAKTVLTSNDPDYREKLGRIQGILGTLSSSERFFSIDELGPIAIKKKPGRRLVPPGKRPTVPQWQKSKGFLILTAALELSLNQVTHFYSKKKNTAEIMRLLELLLVQYRECDKLYLSWDAASWHVSKRLGDWIVEVNSDEYRVEHGTPIVELAPPACSCAVPE